MYKLKQKKSTITKSLRNQKLRKSFIIIFL